MAALLAVLAMVLIVVDKRSSEALRVACDEEIGWETPPPAGWLPGHGTGFSFYVPPEMTFVGGEGIDSDVYSYVSPTLEIAIDFGTYSAYPGSMSSKPGYEEEIWCFDRETAIVCRYYAGTTDGHSPSLPRAAMFFLEGERRPAFRARCTTAEALNTALQIFRTVRYRHS